MQFTAGYILGALTIAGLCAAFYAGIVVHAKAVVKEKSQETTIQKKPKKGDKNGKRNT